MLLVISVAHGQTPLATFPDSHRLKNNTIIQQPGETQVNSPYDVNYIRLNLSIDPAVDNISGSIFTRFTALQFVPSIEMELSTNYTVDSIMYLGAPATFNHVPPHNLTINFPYQLNANSTSEITIYYHGIPPSGQGFGTVGRIPHNGVPTFWTLSEPYGARDWWPSKNDLTDKIDSCDIIVETPSMYRAASNGVLVTDSISGAKRINHWKHRYPVVPYLIAVAVTNYAVYADTATVSGRKVPILNYVYPEDSAEISQQTPQLVPVMELFSELFTEYPFINEKYGHAQFGWGGGMEHQTMSFMGSFDFEIMAHELAHQWFGNTVTLNSWHDIWLNEGFATYLAGLTYEHMFDQTYWMPWKRMTINTITSRPDGSVYVEDTTDIGRIFDSRLSYRKGAYLLHMLRWVAGDDAFFEATRNYLQDPLHEYGFASTDQFKAHLETTSGKDLDEFFDDWYYGQGFPTYHVAVAESSSELYTIKVSQTQSHNSVSFFEMPLPIQLKGDTQDTIVVVNNTINDQTFEVDPGFEVKSVVFDPELWIISSYNEVTLNTEEIDAGYAFRVYPNPSYDFIKVTSSREPDTIYIIDLTGRILYQSSEITGTDMIDISQLKAGSYYVRLVGEGFDKVIYFVKL